MYTNKMNKLLDVIKLNKKVLQKNKRACIKSNVELLKGSLFASAILSGMNFLPLITFYTSEMSWVVFGAGSIILLGLAYAIDKLNDDGVLLLFYIEVTILFCVGIYIGIITNTNNYSVMLAVLLAVAPILILDKEWRITYTLPQCFL